jgi:hypothetical protein
MLNMMISCMGNGESPNIAHMHKAYGTIKQSNMSRNTLYKTLVQEPNVEHIGKIIERAMGEWYGLWIYKISKTMKIG